jgi:hypothetical protein
MVKTEYLAGIQGILRLQEEFIFLRWKINKKLLLDMLEERLNRKLIVCIGFNI